MNAGDIQTIATVAAAVLALIGAIVTKWLDTRSRVIAKKLEVETDFAKQLLTRVESLEMQLFMSRKTHEKLQEQIYSMRSALKEKEDDLKHLSYKYEALQAMYNDLATGERKTLPPPGPREPWPKVRETKK